VDPELKIQKLRFLKNRANPQRQKKPGIRNAMRTPKFFSDIALIP